MKMRDLYLGKRIETATQTFTADDIIRFASRFDPQPFHIDAEAAKDTLFGGLCASGWHTTAVWGRCFLIFWTAECARLEGEGIEPPKLGPSRGFRNLRWIRPVFAGDRITNYVTLTASRDLASKPGWVLNTILCEGENQDGQPVISFESTILEFN